MCVPICLSVRPHTHICTLCCVMYYFKVKSLKEQLESKDLHIDLLRKKLTSLEERLHGQRENIKDHESDSLRMRKLERLAEKYKLQLTDARQEIQNLKAQLLGTTELKVSRFIQTLFKACSLMAELIVSLFTVCLY